MDILIYGTINSVALALYALGFALVYGICRLPNFAHGALYVLSGFIAWVMINTLHTNLFVAVVATLLVTGITGAVIYRVFLIRVRGMEISEIIASYAIALAILEGLRWGGFRGMTYTLPVFIEGSMTIGGISVDYQRSWWWSSGQPWWPLSGCSPISPAWAWPFGGWPRTSGRPSCSVSTRIGWR
jgi:branched-chain amino acid transport system permease protein